MEFRSFFHNPDVSLPVVRRRATEELLQFIASFGAMLATRGRSLMWTDWSPSRPAYDSAVWRLRKSGLIASCKEGGYGATLELTDAGESRLGEAHKPMKLWQTKWNEIWYVLAYDVPEEEREYRDALRGFLARMRMGCLQRSVWVTPR